MLENFIIVLLRFLVYNITYRHQKGSLMYKIFLTVFIVMITGCASGNNQLNNIRVAKEDNLTVGKVQREIKIGMSSAEVVEILGSPNLVSTDIERREVWIYDKISNETVYSSNSRGASILIIGGSSSSGAISTSQRTLTIVLKFDKNSLVRDFSYRASSF